MSLSLFRPRSATGLRTRYLLRLAAGAAVVAACLTPPSWAETDETPEDLFGEVIDVRVVNLEVVVEDDAGRVLDLKPSDFVLTVDGERVPVEYFSSVVGNVSQSPVEPEVAGATVPALQPGAKVGTSYLVFVDDFFPLKQDRDRVLDGLIEQLPNLGPEDRMALVAFDGSKLDMLSSWSRSVPELTRAFQKAKLRDTQGLKRLATFRAFETGADAEELQLGFDRVALDNDDTYATFIAGYQADLTPSEERYARVLFGQADRAVRAAAATLRSFADPPGRKVMVILAGGWPSDPSLWAVGDELRAGRARGKLRGQGLLSPLIETANLLSYTLYPVDVPGMSAAVADAGQITTDLNARRFGLALDRERQEEAALFQLARETGGVALLNTNRTRAFEAVVADTRTYYWLGFTPSWKGDDSGHSVRVRLRDGLGKGLKVRTRRSFSDLSRGTEVDMMVESTLRIGNPPSVAPLQAKIEPGTRAGIGKRNVPVKIAIPLGRLTFLPTANGFAAEAELRVAVLDDKGFSTEIPVVPMSLKTAQVPDPNAFKLYETSITLRKGRHDLVLSLYDKPSGKILATKLEVPAR